MELKELCKECLLYCEKRHNCPFCDIDFSDRKKIIQAMRVRKQKPSTANLIIRKNKRNTEFFFVNQEFSMTGNTSSCSRKRKWYYDNDVLRKVDKRDERATIQNLNNCRNHNRKRSLNAFLDYGQNNDWDYFFTITFDPQKVDSSNQDAVKYAWKKLRQKLQYYFPDIKILAVVEYHADNDKLHFHGAIGNTDISKLLIRAVNNQPYVRDKYGQVIKDKQGNPKYNKYYLQDLKTDLNDKIYNFRNSVYDLGFASIIPLVDRLQDLSSYDKVIYYLAKYMAKDKSAVPYCGKSYFHTHNLAQGKKEIKYMSYEDFYNFIQNEKDIIIKKVNDKFMSFVTNKELIHNPFDNYDYLPKTNVNTKPDIDELDPIFME